MAQILRPRHADPRAPQARAQIPHRSTLLHPPHRIPNSTHAPHRHRPTPAIPAPRPAQRSAHTGVPSAQKHLLADRLRPAAQRRTGGLDSRPCALGLRRDGPRNTGGARRACRRRGASLSFLPVSLFLISNIVRTLAPHRFVCARTARRALMAVIPRTRYACLICTPAATRSA
jgi:hypothetical protein